MTINHAVITFDDFKNSLFNKEGVKTLPDMEKMRAFYDRVIEILASYTPEDSPSQNIEVYFGGFHDTGGYQLIANASVSDMNRSWKNQYNWHLQNTSQWLFACGLVYDKERGQFSLHT